MRWVPCLDWVVINQLDEVCVYVYSKGTLFVCVRVCVCERERDRKLGLCKGLFLGPFSCCRTDLHMISGQTSLFIYYYCFV